eukprot:scaffold25.g5080.t1
MGALHPAGIKDAETIAGALADPHTCTVVTDAISLLTQRMPQEATLATSLALVLPAGGPPARGREALTVEGLAAELGGLDDMVAP